MSNFHSLRSLASRMPRYFLVLFSLLSLADSYGQEDSLAHYLELIGLGITQEDRLIADTAFHRLFVQALQQENAFEKPFEQMIKMGKLTSSDGKLRLFNWNVSLEKGEHRYHCLLLLKDRKGELTLYELKMPERPTKTINERKVLNADQWYGALYYEIIPVKKGAKTYYTLLGWIGKDRLSTRKVIEVLSISGKRVKLGAPIFQLDKQAQYRVVFEYSEEVRMGLGFEEKEQRIVYDNLTPINQDLKGQYQFYGPDGSYNALEWEKGKWMLEADIQVKGESDGPYNAPKQPDLNKLKR